MSGEHDFTKPQQDGTRVCRREGCNVRVFVDGWQRKRGTQWRKIAREPIPQCAGRDMRGVAEVNLPAPRSPIFEARWSVNDQGLVVDGDGHLVVDAKWIDGDDAHRMAAAPDMARALLPLARFVKALDARPMRGFDDVLYSIHGGRGQPGGADIRLSELRESISALLKAGVSEAELEGT